MRLSTLVARALGAGLVLGAGVLFNGGHALAQSKFDGSWSVSFVTESGTCDRAYRYPVAIENGTVRYGSEGGGAGLLDITGRVNASGAVTVNVGGGSDAATASGRLQGKTGSGKWSAPSRGCAGRWRAEKRA